MSDDSDTFATTQIVCGVVLKKDNKYLLVQENKAAVRGQWTFPSGRVDVGETLEAAAIREAKEETGFDVRLDGHHFVMHQQADQKVLHAFRATIVGGTLQIPPSEILDAKWFSYDEIAAIKSKLRNADYVFGAINAT